MKNHFTLSLLLFLAMFSCSKKDTCEDPVDCLPPITQTGEGTIGCLINGEPFTPGGHQLAGPTQQAFYQYVDGGYHFGLSAIDRREKINKTISVFLRKQIVEEGKVYLLNEANQDSNFGEYTIGVARFRTNKEFTGEIKFLKFDDVNGIVSGTFWFDAVNEEGEVVEIREGRFDMKYN